MKKNSTSKKLKAAVAVILVMVSLFAMTVFVSAEFIEEVFNEICATMASSGSGNTICPATASYVYCSNKDCQKQIKCIWTGCTCGRHITTEYPCACPTSTGLEFND